jgi:hypothetical protein
LIDHVLLAENHVADALAHGLELLTQALDLLGELGVGARATLGGGGLKISLTGHGYRVPIDVATCDDHTREPGDRASMSTPAGALTRLIPRTLADEGAAPPRDPASLAGTGHMRIARDGTWYHEGGPIRRMKLVDLFAKVLRREADGTYALVTPAERVVIEVDDAPFVAQELHRRDGADGQVLALRTNLNAWIAADAEHPIFMATSPATGGICPYIRVKPGLDALIARSVFYELAELATPAPDGHPSEAELGVWSHGTFFPLAAGA